MKKIRVLTFDPTRYKKNIRFVFYNSVMAKKMNPHHINILQFEPLPYHQYSMERLTLLYE